MNAILLRSATRVIPDEQILVNVVRQRVRQLIRGHRPLFGVPPGMGFADIALSEVIAQKLGYEAVPGIKPDNSFAPSLVTFPGGAPEKKAA
jgi:hypothetical protein